MSLSEVNIETCHRFIYATIPVILIVLHMYNWVFRLFFLVIIFLHNVVSFDNLKSQFFFCFLLLFFFFFES